MATLAVLCYDSSVNCNMNSFTVRGHAAINGTVGTPGV